MYGDIVRHEAYREKIGGLYYTKFSACKENFSIVTHEYEKGTMNF